MSKAFVKEDDSKDDDDLVESGPTLPPGSKNYMTPSCADRMRRELNELVTVKRPKTVDVVSWAASNGDRSENADYIYGKRRLREIDRRIRFLQKRLENAEIVIPENQKSTSVVFGATVDVRQEDGTVRTYRIVGIDETDGKKGRISWISPLGKALLKTKVGDCITFRAPKGEEELEILEIRYEPF